MTKLEEAQKVMDKLNRKRKAAYPNDPRPAVFIAGQRRDLLDKMIIPSNNETINRLLHGGFKKGLLHLFYGNPNCGKSSAAYELIASAQQRGLQCLLIHTESVFPAAQAEELGVNMDELILVQGLTSGEECMNIVFDLLYDKEKGCPRDAVDLVVIDSVAALVPEYSAKKQDKDGFEAEEMGTHAKMVTRIVNRLFGTGASTNAAVVAINQVRDNVSSYGGGTTQGGGHALKHMAKVIMKFTAPAAGKILDGKKRIGHMVHVLVEKNSAGLGGHPGEEAEYAVIYHEGSDNLQPMIDAALNDELIVETSSSRYVILPTHPELMQSFNVWGDDSPLKIHGMANLKTIVKESEIIKILYEVYHEGKPLEEVLAAYESEI